MELNGIPTYQRRNANYLSKRSFLYVFKFFYFKSKLSPHLNLSLSGVTLALLRFLLARSLEVDLVVLVVDLSQLRVWSVSSARLWIFVGEEVFVVLVVCANRLK